MPDYNIALDFGHSNLKKNGLTSRQYTLKQDFRAKQ
jgi:hypothetical protein